MNLRSLLASMAVSAMIGLTVGCSAAVDSSLVSATSEPPLPPLDDFSAQVCGALASGDKHALGQVVLARVGHSAPGKAPLQEAMEAVTRNCPDLAPGMTPQEMSDAVSPNNVAPGMSTSGDEQHRRGCQQGYITEGC